MYAFIKTHWCRETSLIFIFKASALKIQTGSANRPVFESTCTDKPDFSYSKHWIQKKKKRQHPLPQLLPQMRSLCLNLLGLWDNRSLLFNCNRYLCNHTDMVVPHSPHVSKVCSCIGAVNISPAHDSQGAKTETALKILHSALSTAALVWRRTWNCHNVRYK